MDSFTRPGVAGGNLMSGYAKHFSVAGAAISPQPWMQLRQVQSGVAESVAKNYDPSDGLVKNDPLQTLEVSWTNDSPITQIVYGLVTRGGCQVTLQCRSRAYLESRHGIALNGGTPEMNIVSRFGTGGDVGQGGLLALSSGFAIAEVRGNSSTAPLLPGSNGQWAIAPGDSITARVEIYFISEFWENTRIDGGETGTSSKVVSGETLLQLMAIPAITDPPAVTTPTLVGGTTNIKVGRAIDQGFVDDTTSVTKPSSLQAGDHLLAIVVNQFGLLSDLGPVQTGWTQLHERDAGWENSHMKVYVRMVTGSEPSSYSFGNGFLAEETVILIPIRSAAPHDPGAGSGWNVASSLTQIAFARKSTFIAPAINRRGQLLITFSFIPLAPNQTPVTITPPTGMTEWLDSSGVVTHVSLAALATPPTPTLERTFTLSTASLGYAKSITASILIPGS